MFRERIYFFILKGIKLKNNVQDTVTNVVNIEELGIGVFHFFAINLIFSIWIDHPTYEVYFIFSHLMLFFLFG